MVPGTIFVDGPIVTPVGGGWVAVAVRVYALFRFEVRCLTGTRVVEYLLGFPLEAFFEVGDPATITVRVTASGGRASFTLCPLTPAAMEELLRRLNRRFDGTMTGEQMGLTAASCPDPDPVGAGYVNVLAGGPSAAPGGSEDAGCLHVFSGRTGAGLHTYGGPASGDEFGFSVADVGDLDGDGVSDYLVGSPSASPGGRLCAGSAFLISGATGAVLRRFDGEARWDQFGWSVASAGDVDGDGVNDLLVGAPSTDPGGREDAGTVYLFSGADGSPLRRFDGPATGDALGYAVLGGVDIDGDGTPDVVCGAPSASPAGLDDAGSVLIYSGASGALVRRIDGLAAGDEFGFSLAAAGDVDGDGTPDLVIGAPSAAPGGRRDAGSVFVCSGSTGAVLARGDGPSAGDELGVSVAGDLDAGGGGTLDFAGGAPSSSAGGGRWTGSVLIFSGIDGSLLRRLDGEAAGDEFGWALSSTRSAGGYGLHGLIVGAPEADPDGRTDAGRAYLYALAASEAAICGRAFMLVTISVTRSVSVLVPVIEEARPRRCVCPDGV
jgi:hypothetical protein